MRTVAAATKPYVRRIVEEADASEDLLVEIPRNLYAFLAFEARRRFLLYKIIEDRGETLLVALIAPERSLVLDPEIEENSRRLLDSAVMHEALKHARLAELGAVESPRALFRSLRWLLLHPGRHIVFYVSNETSARFIVLAVRGKIKAAILDEGVQLFEGPSIHVGAKAIRRAHYYGPYRYARYAIEVKRVKSS